MTSAVKHASLNNYDTAWSSASRFLVEVAAWVAGPWAAASLTGSGWVVLPVLVVLVAIPAVFSTPGDKNQIVVATPGPVRVVIEIGLLSIAIAAALVVWPVWAAVLIVVVGFVMLIAGRRRLAWLLSGAPA